MKHQQRIFMRKVADNAATILVFVMAVAVIAMLVVIAKQHVERPPPLKTVTITGFQEPMMMGYSFLDTKDKLKLSANEKVDIRQDLGVKAAITTYRDNETHTVDTADVLMWRMVQ